MKFLKNFLLVFLLVTTLTSQAQDSLSLTSAIVIGLENNFQIRIAQENVRIADNMNTLGMAGAFPNISLGYIASARYYDNDLDIKLNEASNIYTGPNVLLNWTIFNGFAVNIRKEQFDKLYDLSMGYSAVIVENTLQGIILAYYRVLLEKESLKILKDVQKLSRDRYTYTETRKSLGSAVSYDVLQAQNAYLSDSSNYLIQQVNYKNSVRNLNLLLGENVEKRFVFTDSVNIKLREFDYAELSAMMFQSNNTLKNQYINQFLLKQDVRMTRTYLYPSIGLNSGGDFKTNSLKIGGTDVDRFESYNYYANISLSYTLFNGRKFKTAVENAMISEAIGMIQTDELKLSLSNQLMSYYELYNVRKQVYEVAIENRESAELNLQISKDKFISGAINSFNFRDVQNLYLNAAISELKAIFDVIDAEVELMRLSGSLVFEN